MKGTLTGHVGQRVGSGPVDISAAIHFTPSAFRRNHNSTPDGICPHGPQPAPAAAVLDDHLVAVGDPARGSIVGMNLQKCRPLALQKPGLICQAAADKVM